MEKSFPYKREFVNPDDVWNETSSKSYTTVQVLDKIPNSRRWTTLPKGIEWGFQGTLVAFITSSDAYDKVNILTDYFSEPARMMACRKGKPSPLQYFQQKYAEVEQKAQQIAQQTRPFRHWLREAVYALTSECTTFKISLTKSIFEYFGSKVILDPSGGWGDRLLGAAAAGVVAYHAIEPNPNLVQPYKEMMEFAKRKAPNTQLAVVHEDFLSLDFAPGSYDTVFTSPPFYDYEQYVSDSKQSIHGNPSLQEWTRDFFYPYLKKAWEALASGGYFIIYISDTRDKYCLNMYNYLNRELSGSFLGVIPAAPDTLSRGYPIWVWRK